MILDVISGIVIVDKEKGFTSHDVVNVIRKIFGTRKVGHTGTLDPDATGVLPVCIGKGTKVCDMLTFSDKQYEAVVRLGLVTDTQDISGNVLEEHAVDVNESDVRRVVGEYVGEIDQIPPMYSAIKIGGQKLCDLARKGVEVERKPRKVTVYSSLMSDFDGVNFRLKVDCSKGTYIRTLCHDIGKALGCGAVMTELRRTKASIFDISAAHTLGQLQELASEGKLSDVLMPVDSVFEDYPPLKVGEKIQKRLCNGAPSYINAAPGTYRIYSTDGTFLCIASVDVARDGTRFEIRLKKAFY